MTLKNGDRFTVYDAMEASGYFLSNPANPGARTDDGRSLYVGPVKFPMMVYHPLGEERVIVPGTMERTPYGTVEKFGEQTELVWKSVENEDELSAALAEGWHKHPAPAIKRGNETWRKEQGLAPKAVPSISASSRITDLEEQNKRLLEQLEQAKKDEDALAEGPVKVIPSTKAAARAGLV